MERRQGGAFVSKQERYGTCSDEEGNWGIEDDGKVILSGLVSHDACDAVMDILDERDALKAEVERLTKQNALATPRHLIASQDITSLREEVERLTKAGDAMAEALLFEDDMSCKEIADWNAAKEGKQSNG
jgi:hypothetical protein